MLVAVTQKTDESRLTNRHKGLSVNSFLSLGGSICNFSRVPLRQLDVEFK